jgi:hypothetical protein
MIANPDTSALARLLEAQMADVAAGRCIASQRYELGFLLADARCAVGRTFPRELMHLGACFRLGVEGTLNVFSGNEVPEPLGHLTPLYTERICVGFRPRR